METITAISEVTGSGTSKNGIESVGEYIQIIQKIFEIKYYDLNKNKEKILFRGEVAGFDEYCCPNVFRQSLNQHIDQQHNELKTYNRIKSYNHVDEKTTYLNVAIEAQHGGLISRLLDLTENALIALMFSLVDGQGDLDKENENKPGYVYVFKASELLDSSDKATYENFEKMIMFSGENHFKYREHYFIGYASINDRIRQQQGYFLLLRSYSLKIINNVSKIRIKIAAEKKANIYKELDEYFGINRHYIYPEITNLSGVVKDEIGRFSTFSDQDYIERLNE